MSEVTKLIAEALLQTDTPYVWRRTLDKDAYEVIRADNEDWREVVSDERTVMLRTKSSARAEQTCRELEREWQAQQIIDALARHGFSVTRAEAEDGTSHTAREVNDT